jgi:hypothetical protein
METLEDLYTNAFQKHDEAITAANPYGCNQYGHRKGHQGGSSPSASGSSSSGGESKKKESGLSEKDADDMVDDIYEIALEEGGYEKLYDTPKDKLKQTIKRELVKSGSKSMFGDMDTGESGTSAKYSWWRKNRKKIVDSL